MKSLHSDRSNRQKESSSTSSATFSSSSSSSPSSSSSSSSSASASPSSSPCAAKREIVCGLGLAVASMFAPHLTGGIFASESFLSSSSSGSGEFVNDDGFVGYIQLDSDAVALKAQIAKNEHVKVPQVQVPYRNNFNPLQQVKPAVAGRKNTKDVIRNNNRAVALVHSSIGSAARRSTGGARPRVVAAAPAGGVGRVLDLKDPAMDWQLRDYLPEDMMQEKFDNVVEKGNRWRMSAVKRVVGAAPPSAVAPLPPAIASGIDTGRHNMQPPQAVQVAQVVQAVPVPGQQVQMPAPQQPVPGPDVEGDAGVVDEDAFDYIPEPDSPNSYLNNFDWVQNRRSIAHFMNNEFKPLTVKDETKYKAADKLLDKIISLGVRLIATDFDKTITTRHSHGVCTHDNRDFLSSLSKDFDYFANAANERKLKIVVVSFADTNNARYRGDLAGEDLIRAVMKQSNARFLVDECYCFNPTLYTHPDVCRIMMLRGPMWNNKWYHLQRAMRDYGLKPFEILFIDDDVTNCVHAASQGFPTIRVDGGEGFDLQKLTFI